MRKFFIISILPILVLCSCDDILDVKQINLVYNEIYWQNEDDAEKGVLGIYALYRGLMIQPTNWYQRADATTGFLNRGWNGGSPDALYKMGNFEDLNAPKSWGELEGYANWGAFYKVIAQANLVIKKIEEIPSGNISAKSKDKLLGEAYFLRALTYFNIMRIWGNAPYISEAIESSTQLINDDLTPIVIPRTQDIKIGEKVLADVEKAIELLEYGLFGNSEWGIRANRGSAEALAGHVNMWMYFLANRDVLDSRPYLTAAITSLENVTTRGGYSLVDYSSPTVLKTLYEGQSTEAVFELNISSQTNESYRVDHGGIIQLTCKIISHDGDETKDRASYINFVPKSQKSLIYPEYDVATQTGDIRANLFFAAWESNYDEPFNDISPTANNRNLVTWMKKYALMTVDPMRSWNEYSAYFAEANIPVFRYTDIYLLLAEAYQKDNQKGKALAIVNEVRSRAGLGPYTGSDLLHEILQQRVSELIGEGQIYYDMVRNNWFPNQQVMEADRYNQQGYYWPVSGAILTANKEIEQTPYWNGKTKW